MRVSFGNWLNSNSVSYQLYSLQEPPERFDARGACKGKAMNVDMVYNLKH
jgi:hypothetical protein